MNIIQVYSMNIIKIKLSQNRMNPNAVQVYRRRKQEFAVSRGRYIHGA